MLDREKVGALMQEREGGMFINGYYVIPSEYEPVLAYDGVVLPDSEEENTIEMEPTIKKSIGKWKKVEKNFFGKKAQQSKLSSNSRIKI